MLGDSVTTDHISPAGSIKPDSPAGRYLQSHGVERKDFNSYGSRRGNHEVMMRGTFANIRIRNEMVPGVEGGMTRHLPGTEVVAIYDAAMQYQQENIPGGYCRERVWLWLQSRLGGKRPTLAGNSRGYR